MTKKTLNECFAELDEAWQEFDQALYQVLLPWIRRIDKVISKVRHIIKPKKG